MVVKTRTPAPEKLKFADKLVKNHATDVLLKKLKARISLHRNRRAKLNASRVLSELSQMDQERVDTKSLGSIRKELIHSSLLLHKDKGVKAYIACSLADLLRLYAPDAPYTAHELRDIFQFFIRQLTSGLKSPDAPYYAEYFYLLESLSSIKSIVLVCDLPQADDLMIEIFREFFDLIRHDMAKNVELFMADILVSLIDEAQTLPQELLDIILAQFMLKPLQKVPPPPQRLAVEVCTRTSERLQRSVCQYFTDVILQNDDDDDIERIRVAHDLVKSLNRECPALLLNVVPQLEEELRVDRLQMRCLATQALGEMFGDPRNGVELARKYHSAWQVWLQRRNDKAPPVRLAFVESTKGLIVNHAEFRAEIEEALLSKLMDPDEKVRAATCRVYSQLDYETALHHVSSKQLKEVATRCMDKKQIVRTEAFACLGKLYRLSLTEIESAEALAVEQFSWIPSCMLKAASVSSEVKSEAEEMVFRHVLPFPSRGEDEASWTEQLLTVIKYLDDRALHALMAMSNIKTTRPSIFDKFIDQCALYNGGIIDQNEEEVTRNLNRTISLISGTFPEPSKVSENLHTFAKVNEGRLYKLLRSCVDPEADLKTLVKSQNELLRRVEQTNPTILDTMGLVLRRTMLWVVNRSSIPTLMKRLRLDDSTADPTSMRVQTLLQFASKHCPVIYKPHAVELAKAIGETKHLRLTESSLQALASIVHHDNKLAPTDRRTIDELTKHALGNKPRLSKFSARLLASCSNKTTHCTGLMDKLVATLSGAQGDALVSCLVVLAQFAFLVPDVFEAKKNSGSAKSDSGDSEPTKTRVRLQAATSLLKLSTSDIYCKPITANLPLLADPCFHVRSRFLSKLINHLVARRLDARFNIIPFLTAHDPEKEIRDKARSYITHFSQRGPPDVKTSNFELIFIRLLHMLAHHPDFSTDVDGIRDMAKYIEFYVDLVATPDNVSLLLHLSSKAKTVRDSESDRFSENLYVMSELASHVIKARAKSQSWTLASFPGKIKLPTDIFKPHPSADEASKVLKHVYLPSNASSVLEGIGKAWKSPNQKVMRDKPPRKRKDSAMRLAAETRTKRRRRRSSDDVDSDSTEDMDEDASSHQLGHKDDLMEGITAEEDLAPHRERRISSSTTFNCLKYGLARAANGTTRVGA
ncbi:hypothetical protein FRB99_006230 [Tulasnella sp. 403]|nr:hypothetical protein FRB99_006230 [Tulasnella sp. 403]